MNDLELDMPTEGHTDFDRSHFSDLDSQSGSDDSLYPKHHLAAGERHHAATVEQNTATIASIRYHFSQLPDLRMFYLFLDIIEDTRLVASRTPKPFRILDAYTANPLSTLCVRILDTFSLDSLSQNTDDRLPFDTIATHRSLAVATNLPDIVLLPQTIDVKLPSPLYPLCVLLTACRFLTLPP